MTAALIGHTGFVGGNLARQYSFDACFNSRNIEDVSGRSFDLLVVSGMPAAKWLANRDPAADRAGLQRLLGCLRQVQANQVVVISTVDVYPQPVGVDEDSPIDPGAQHPYGYHRRLLEEEIVAHFANVLIVRLPGLFGPGLKKNVIFDLLHANELHKIDAGSVFQFYNLDHLWADLQTARSAGLRLVNLVAEPVSVRELVREAFGLAFDNQTGMPPARYDVRSRHALVFGGRDGYQYERDRVLRELAEFVQRQRGAL